MATKQPADPILTILQSGCSRLDKSLLVSLTYIIDTKGKIWLTTKVAGEVAACANLPIPQLKEQVQQLVASGLLRRFDTDLYEINWEKLPTKAAAAGLRAWKRQQWQN
jgi:hypothetical protein